MKQKTEWKDFDTKDTTQDKWLSPYGIVITYYTDFRWVNSYGLVVVHSGMVNGWSVGKILGDLD